MPDPGTAATPAANADVRVTLRPAQPADAPALCAVHARAIRALRDSVYAPDALEAWATRTRPEDYRVADPSRCLVVAEAATAQGPRVAGYGQLHIGEGTIEALYVDPDLAHQGIGGLLVHALERKARAANLPGLIVEASQNSVRFYRALGFVAKGVDRHVLAPGIGIDCIVMEKRFGRATSARA